MQYPGNTKGRLSLFTVLVIAIVVSFLRLSEPPANILAYDVFGYYLYLPGLVINGDPASEDIGWIEEINEQYGNSPTLYQVHKLENGRWIIRFFSGMAIMFLPFFLLGHVYAVLSIWPADGFSEPYQWSMIIGGLVYTLLGIFLMRKVLLKFFSDKVTTVTLISLFLGSNIFFFSAIGSDIPHVYLFFLYTSLLWFTIRWHETFKLRYMAYLGLVMGLIVISRPSELISVLIPLLWGVYNIRTFREKLILLWEKRKQVTVFALCGLVMVIPQFVYWFHATGAPIFWAYNDPGSALDLAYPNFHRALFGFRKGLYVYAPMIFIATIGFWRVYKDRKDIFLPLVLFFLLNAYLISSFSSLISYGWRAFIQSYAMMAIPLGFVISWIFRKQLLVRIPALVLLLLIIAINLFQAWQLKMGIIDGSRMTREYYFAVFGKTSVTEEDRKLLLVKRSEETWEYFSGDGDYEKSVSAELGFEAPDMSMIDYYDTIHVFSGGHSLLMNPGHQFSKGYNAPYSELTDSDHAWVRVGVWIYPTSPEAAENTVLVCTFDHKGAAYKYRGFTLAASDPSYRINEWNYLTFDYMTPEPRRRSDKLSVYVWYKGSEGYSYIDDLRVEVFRPVQ